MKMTKESALKAVKHHIRNYQREIPQRTINAVVDALVGDRLSLDPLSDKYVDRFIYLGGDTFKRISTAEYLD